MKPMVPEANLLEEALNKLRENTGLDVWEVPPPVAPHTTTHLRRPDARIVVARGKQETLYWVEIKKIVDRHGILVAFAQLAAQVGQKRLATEGGGLLITNQLTEELAEHCRRMHLQFLDAAGNAYLNQDGLFVLIQGKRIPRSLRLREKPARAFDRTGLRVVFVLLVDPELLNAPYREIAKAAGVALGTVGRILTDLRMQGLIVEQKDGQRRWVDRDRAMKAWALNYPLRLRPKLNPRRYRATNDTWWNQADPAAFGGCWGGEVAAAREQGNLAPATATLYLPENRNPFLAAHRLKADDQGPIEILDAFWDLPERPEQARGLAPDLLIYADLAGMGDPRTHEEAERIYDDLLAGA